MEAIAELALYGVGDASFGEWRQMPGQIFHFRRRLTPEEAEVTGPVLDIRGTEEADRRRNRIVRLVPQAANFAPE